MKQKLRKHLRLAFTCCIYILKLIALYPGSSGFLQGRSLGTRLTEACNWPKCVLILYIIYIGLQGRCGSLYQCALCTVFSHALFITCIHNQHKEYYDIFVFSMTMYIVLTDNYYVFRVWLCTAFSSPVFLYINALETNSNTSLVPRPFHHTSF